MSELSRRELLAGGLVALTGCPTSSATTREAPLACKPSQRTDGAYDYVVVGSGAGGGPVACRLAQAGYRVALIEAGGDPSSWTRAVPALHAASVEDPALRWDFYVRTYDSEEQQRRNEKYVAAGGGVLYPRAGTLGGCTAHNALITVYPHPRDFDEIAALLGDPSWSADAMRAHFERLERCDYAPNDAGGANASRHGFDGWLHTQTANPWLGLGDSSLRWIIDSAVDEASGLDAGLAVDAVKMALTPDQALWDPNDARMVAAAREGVVFVPLHTKNGARFATREYVLETAGACPNHLTVLLDTLACRVVFDDDATTPRAIGVEVVEGASLYRAAAASDRREELGPRRVIRAAREVILAGGAFNSPQLLMLSGVGERATLERFGITPRVDLPGVGKNLQDRYELGVVSEMARDFDVVEGAALRPPSPEAFDPLLDEWWRDRKGPYATNGVVSAMIKRSSSERPEPDLFLFGLVGAFKGYYPGFSRDLVRDKRHFTWGVLKAHTENRAGEVRLASADPRDRPEIRFHYFEEGSPGYEQDLAAVVDGVRTVRRIMRRLGDRVVREVVPGPEVETPAQIAAYVRDQAWGHHASCSNKLGPRSDPMAVVDGDFRVHGTAGLRVVDASVFPRIPGFFILSSVLMIAEKAAVVIARDAALADARTGT